jgi:hypothetical protein
MRVASKECCGGYFGIGVGEWEGVEKCMTKIFMVCYLANIVRMTK